MRHWPVGLLLALPALAAAAPAPHFSCAIPLARCPATFAGQRVATCDVRHLSVAGRHFVKTTYHLLAPKRTDEDRTGEQWLQVIAIANPRSASERLWNDAVRQRVVAYAQDEYEASGPIQADDPQRIDYTAGADLIAVSRDFVSVAFSVSWYWTTMAHPNGNTAGISWPFRLGRELTGQDLFRPDRPWATALAKVVQAQVTENGDYTPGGSTPIATIDDRRVWRVSAGGLRFVYDPYDLGGYLSAAETALDWHTLQPYLRPDLPFTPSALVDIGPDPDC